MILCCMAWQSVVKFPCHNFPSVDAKAYLRALLKDQIDRMDPVNPPQTRPKRAKTMKVAGGSKPGVVGRVGDAEWDDVEGALKGCYVRLNQFVKTYVHPTRTMLEENFIRSTGIVCKENEPTADLLLPMAVLSTEDTLVTESCLSAIVVQVKLRNEFMGTEEIETWISKIAELSCLPKNDPVVAILLEFSPKTSTSKKENLVIRRILGRPNAFAIFSRRLCPADILENEEKDGEISRAFQNLLESHVDPCESRNVEESTRNQIKNMFVGPPYAFGYENSSSYLN